jgi:hypothetical protein
LITTSCTLLPVIALLVFGGATLQDFAFALLVGVASGAYSSIFIASPVLTHWKEREHGYRARRARIIADHGYVPAYADGGDVDPTPRRVRSTGRLTAPPEENVSAAEFEQMKADLGLDEDQPRGRPSRLTARTAHETEEDDQPATSAARAPRAGRSTLTPPAVQPAVTEPPVQPNQDAPSDGTSVSDETSADAKAEAGDASGARERPVTPAPDEAENDGVVETPKGSGAQRRPKNRNRRHGRRR